MCQHLYCEYTFIYFIYSYKLIVARVDINRKTRLVFWDLGGQSSLHSLWNKYYEEAHGVIYVIDSADKERLSQSQKSFGMDKQFNFLVEYCNRFNFGFGFILLIGFLCYLTIYYDQIQML